MREGSIVADRRITVMPRVFDDYRLNQLVSLDGVKYKVIGRAHEQGKHYIYLNDTRRAAWSRLRLPSDGVSV